MTVPYGVVWVLSLLLIGVCLYGTAMAVFDGDDKVDYNDGKGQKGQR